ncbi:MAG: hypothetical protein QNK37_01300 [Acidobacteriota bacterium]|nr:hypothetical protein [Acidobacteriota bacterium]
MRKYIVALIVFALSFFVGVPQFMQDAPALVGTQPAIAAEAGIFGRPPIGTELDGAGFGECEVDSAKICISQ